MTRNLRESHERQQSIEHVALAGFLGGYRGLTGSVLIPPS